MESISQKTIQVNGISMHVAEKGPTDGPVILFLHSFPELWCSWRHQILSLSERGFRCIAPDMRGYDDTSAPPSVSSYTIFQLVGDFIALLDNLSLQQVVSVGNGNFQVSKPHIRNLHTDNSHSSNPHRKNPKHSREDKKDVREEYSEKKCAGKASGQGTLGKMKKYSGKQDPGY